MHIIYMKQSVFVYDVYRKIIFANYLQNHAYRTIAIIHIFLVAYIHFSGHSPKFLENAILIEKYTYVSLSSHRIALDFNSI